MPRCGGSRQHQQGAAGCAGEVRRGAAEHQSPERTVTPRSDYEQVDFVRKRGQLVARKSDRDLTVDAVERSEPILGSVLKRLDHLAPTFSERCPAAAGS